MGLSQAILAILTKQPASGYELAKKFNEELGLFWKTAQQQVYRELAKLEAQGWVRYEVIPRDGHLDKKLYSITHEGEQQLAEWIKQPCQPAIIREDLLVKMLAGHLVKPEILRLEMERHRLLHQQILLNYRELCCCNYSDDSQLSPENQLRRMALKLGIRLEEDWVSWCDEVIVLLRNLEAQYQPNPSEHGGTNHT